MWIWLMWACFGVALAAALVHSWWLMGAGWLLGTVSATRSGPRVRPDDEEDR